jgi:lipopolysaccharide transport system permease protein
MIELHIKSENRFSLGARELWQYRELFYFFTWRNVKIRYKQAVLGIVWAIMQPLSILLVFTLVFKQGLNIGSEGLPYPVFAFSGLMVWNFFSSSLQNAASSMVSNQAVITKIYFPRLIIPIAAILTALFDWFISFSLWVVLIVFFQVPIVWWKLFFIPLSILLTTVTAFGLGTFLAGMNVKYRDFQYALPFLMQFLLFLNPVVYSTNVFANYGTIKKILELNPIAGAINLIRSIFSQEPINVFLLCQQFGIAIIFMICGIYIFKKTEAYFADVV